jgi:AcrR family transcriptional regulator
MPATADPLRATLPPGRHGLPREFVAENQRVWLFDATAAVLARKTQTTIGEICTEASLSRRTLYEHFDGLPALAEAVLRDAFEQLDDALDGVSSPDEGVDAVLAFIDRDEDRARALLLSGPCWPDIYVAGMEKISARVCGSPVQRQGVVGGVTRLLAVALDSGSVEDLRDDLIAFVSLAVR